MDICAPYHTEVGTRGAKATAMISLLLREPVTVDADALRQALERHAGRAEPSPHAPQVAADVRDALAAGGTGGDTPEAAAPDVLAFDMPEYVSAPEDEPVSASVVVMPLAQPDAFDNLRHALPQTWDWPDAASIAKTHRACVVVADAAAEALPAVQRLQLLNGTVRALLDLAEPLAIHWLPAMRVIEPGPWREQIDAGIGLESGAVNVRLVQVTGERPDEYLMDTCGLRLFGLPDLQCYFRRLDPNEVGHLLYNYAGYLFTNGDVFDDGDTIRGFAPGGAEADWHVRRTTSALDPLRPVVDLVPGAFSPAANQPDA